MKKRYLIIITVLFLIDAVLGCLYVNGFFDVNNDSTQDEHLSIVNLDKKIDSNVEDNENKTYKLADIYKENKAINSDYLGQIYFDSGLIYLPFVKGDTNEMYLNSNWQTKEYELGGSIFIDCDSTIGETQNVVMYGHNFNTTYDPDSIKMFSPLRVLRDQNNYEQNKYFNLFMGDVLYRYEIAYVYRVKVIEEDGIQYLDENEPNYLVRKFNEKTLNKLVNKMEEREYYSTGVDIDENDQFLTIQTCIDRESDKYVIFSKLVDTIYDVNDIEITLSKDDLNR